MVSHFVINVMIFTLNRILRKYTNHALVKFCKSYFYVVKIYRKLRLKSSNLKTTLINKTEIKRCIFKSSPMIVITLHPFRRGCVSITNCTNIRKFCRLSRMKKCFKQLFSFRLIWKSIQRDYKNIKTVFLTRYILVTKSYL